MPIATIICCLHQVLNYPNREDASTLYTVKYSETAWTLMSSCPTSPIGYFLSCGPSSHLVQNDHSFLVRSGDVKCVPWLSIQDGILQLGIVSQISICCRDPAHLRPWHGQLRHREQPGTWDSKMMRTKRQKWKRWKEREIRGQGINHRVHSCIIPIWLWKFWTATKLSNKKILYCTSHSFFVDNKILFLTATIDWHLVAVNALCITITYK